MDEEKGDGDASEQQVKRGHRTIRGGEIELLEKLGNNDLCPLRIGTQVQKVLP